MPKTWRGGVNGGGGAITNEVIARSTGAGAARAPVRLFSASCGFRTRVASDRPDQHHLLPEANDLIRYDRRGGRENLTTGLGLSCVHTRVLPFKDRTIHGFGYELPPDVPADADWRWNLRNWYTIAFRKA